MVKSNINSIINRFSIASWNSSIREAVNRGHAQNALLLFRQMKRNSNVQPNNLTFPFIAKACAKLSYLKYSQMIHANVAKSPFCSDVYLQTALVDMYVKCSCLDHAYNLFDNMPERDLAAWNVIIMGFAQLGFIDRVSCLFNGLRMDNIMPDAVTIMGLTQLVSGVKDTRLLSAVHCFGMTCGHGGDVSVANTWIAGYSKCGDLFSAEMVFCGIGLDALTVVSWNAMIGGCGCVEEPVKAVGVYQRMILDGFRPDLCTILNLLLSCTQPSSLCYGMLIHAHGIKVGCHEDIAVLNTLISMYSKCGNVDMGRSVFSSMTERTPVSWTSMIGGYSAKGDLDEALSLFHAMEASGETPDFVTTIHLISACGQIGALEVGKWIDNYTILMGLKSNVMVCNALLDMYAKCGSLIDAQELFGTMHGKTVVSWTTMIAGYALNGKTQEALDHFYRMLKLGLKPNHITFLAVLQACTHAGLLEKGREIFDMMIKVYGINPGLDHYACMTDLLGRQGKLKEALTFIQDMPLKPDAGIWGALLCACKIHHNLELGEYATHYLLQLEPQAAAPYVEMANIYASAEEWDGVAAMRMKMKCKEVTKSPGQSAILVNGKHYSFTVEDRHHSQGFQIFETLDNLVLQLKDEVHLFCPPELVES
ncbi:Pentatricopeptide repeat-containing protein [Forsythia ovata]|uniref:Pentatricopeptide repeat-containing protein n=1 Tax=Forsythia ovata TaxID=205694 RepID=A0ABD1U8W9_9LAMI